MTTYTVDSGLAVDDAGSSAFFKNTATRGGILQRSSSRFVAPILLGATMLGTLGAVTEADAAALQQRARAVGTFSTPRVDSDLSEPQGMFSTALVSLRRRSGLSYGEIATAIGVSRRTLHLWLANGKVSARNAGRLSALVALVGQHEQMTAPLTRSRLLAPSGDGTSVLSAFAASGPPSRSVPLSTQKLANFVDRDLSVGTPPSLPKRPSTLKGQRVARRSGRDG